MPLLESIETVKEDIASALKVGADQVSLSQKELLLFGMIRLILGGIDATGSGEGGSSIDNVALAGAIANALEEKTLTVAGDTVNESVLAAAIASTTQPISASSLPLPTDASTETTLSALLTELIKKTNTTDISSVNLNKYGNNRTVSFSNSTFSESFTLVDKYLIAVVPVMAGSPNITLQISLDGATYVDTSISITASSSFPVVFESDLFNRIIACIGLTNALRFRSSASITAAIVVRNSHG